MEEWDEHLIKDMPFKDGIVLMKVQTTGQRFTNVPHLAVHHSPTGYEWGYSGSGPSDLALNIVENILWDLEYDGPRIPMYEGTCFEMTTYIYQQFKRQFIADACDDTVIDYDEACNFVDAEMQKIIKRNGRQ